MRNDPPDRQQMQEDLRELAKLAGTPAPGTARDKAHAFESADSSGYVDLSAYRADDESWIERELARAKTGGPTQSQTAGQRTIDGLSPQSMAPVALEALLEANDKLEDEEPAPRRRWPLALAGVASAAAVAALAVVVARNAPHAAPQTPQGAAAAAPPPAVTAPAATTEPAQAPDPAQQPPQATAVAASAPPPSAQPSSAPKKPQAVHASRSHAAATVAAAKPAAPHPVAVPAASHPAKSSGSGDSLMDLIRASVKK